MLMIVPGWLPGKIDGIIGVISWYDGLQKSDYGIMVSQGDWYLQSYTPLIYWWHTLKLIIFGNDLLDLWWFYWCEKVTVASGSVRVIDICSCKPL